MNCQLKLQFHQVKFIVKKENKNAFVHANIFATCNYCAVAFDEIP